MSRSQIPLTDRLARVVTTAIRAACTIACIKKILGAESYSCSLLSTRNDSLTGSKHSLLTLRHQGKRTGRGCGVLKRPHSDPYRSPQTAFGRRGSVPEESNVAESLFTSANQSGRRKSEYDILSCMAVSLTKIIDGKAAIRDTLRNEAIVRCPSCDQTFRLGYSDNEWNWVKDWLAIAERALRQDHKGRHELTSIGLELRTTRKR